MRTTPRNINWLFVSIGALSLLGWFVNAIPPNSGLSVGGLFVCISIATYALSLFITRDTRQAALIATGVIAFLLLRYANLRHPLYVLLLIASLLSLELTAQKR